MASKKINGKVSVDKAQIFSAVTLRKASGSVLYGGKTNFKKCIINEEKNIILITILVNFWLLFFNHIEKNTKRIMVKKIIIKYIGLNNLRIVLLPLIPFHDKTNGIP